MQRRRLSQLAAISAVGLLSTVVALAGANPAQAADPIQAGGDYVAVGPTRILDTRPEHDTDFPDHPCFSAETQTLQVTGPIRNAPTNAPATTGQVVPPTAAAVALNVTAVGADNPGWITVWGSGAEPTASSLNYVQDTVGVPNSVIARLDTTEGHEGEISISANFGAPQVSTGCPDVVVDVVGYYTKADLDDETTNTPETKRPLNGGYRASTSAAPRVMDTRSQELPSGNKGCIATGAHKTLDLTNAGGIPASGVKAAVLNVTVVNPTAQGWISVWPEGQAAPGGNDANRASNLNYVKDQVIANLVIAPLGTADNVSFGAFGGGCPNLVVDVVGWIQAGAVTVPGTFTSIAPTRITDTRPNPPGGRPAGSLDHCISTPQSLKVAGLGGIPGIGDAKPPAVVALNVTAVDAQPGPGGWITVYPTAVPAGDAPYTSNLNYRPGPQAVPNVVLAKVGPTGEVSFDATEGCPHIVVDVVGWWSAPEATLAVTSTTPVAVAVKAPATEGTVDVTVKNDSTYNDTTAISYSDSGTDAGEFARVDGGTCSSTPLAAGASCTVRVKWTPSGSPLNSATANLKLAGGLDDTGDVVINGTYTPATSFFADGGGTGAWATVANAPSGATDTRSVELVVPDADAYAGVQVDYADATAPATAPSFRYFSTVAGDSGGSPRLVIRFADGGNVQLRPLTLVADAWTLVDGAVGTNFDNVGGTCGDLYGKSYADALACHTGSAVTEVYVVSDSGWKYPSGYTHRIDDISYDGVVTSKD